MFWNIFGSLVWFIATCAGSFATVGLLEDEEFGAGILVGLVTLASWSLMITLIVEAASG